MSQVPPDLRFTKQHEWARQEEGRVRVGITDFAQEQLGDVVFLNLPEVGSSVQAGQALGEIESTKSVADIYAPITGTVVEVNTEAADDPAAVNQEPYGRGWLVLIEPDDSGVLDTLLDAAGYQTLLSDEGGEHA